MSALNFPDSPNENDLHTAENGVTYVFTNGGWMANSVPGLSGAYVSLYGDTMTGNLMLPGGGGATAALQSQEIQLLIDASGGGGGGGGDLYWERDAGALSPKVSTDSVDIGDGNITLNADGKAEFVGDVWNYTTVAAQIGKGFSLVTTDGGTNPARNFGFFRIDNVSSAIGQDVNNLGIKFIGNLGNTNTDVEVPGKATFGLPQANAGNLSITTAGVTGGQALITLQSGSDIANSCQSGIAFGGGSGNHRAFIYGGHTNAGNTILAFQTSDFAGGAENPRTKMLVNSDGNIFIGGDLDNLAALSPNTQLHADGTANFKKVVVNPDTSTNVFTGQGDNGFFNAVYVSTIDVTCPDSSNHIFCEGNGSVVFTVSKLGVVTPSNVIFNLEADDDTKYTATTDSEGNETRVYNGEVLDVKERIQNVLARMDAIEANEVTDDATDSALLTLVANLSSRLDERDVQIAALTARLDAAGA